MATSLQAMEAQVSRIGEGSTLFALAVAVFSDLQMAFVGDVHELKEQLRLYAEIDESTHSLRLSELDITPIQVTFGVNTSGIEGADFYLTIFQNDTVAYHDGMEENNILIYPAFSDS
jgi:ABC-type proline/glycine betaine transport system substrate-binding protein